ncbi:hypothetical protein [Chlorogloea sp. CCALA 695]|uniref:hypothetical protein n=1 Tax=Chlorogloea sp. CCALA 695 TaxID=2107693 RepID=UPI000D053E81|nr:hypothetical protein [Chlorogloea sp. CCALA 695]PSB30833.1 hypothetical protein C7B70_15370 [Chlorogloea sp. CCALA 695]
MKFKFLVQFQHATCVSAISFTLSLAPILSADAGIVRQIAASQLSGQTAENLSLQTVEVWKGHGVSVSFYKTGEVIKKVWLDDPSNIVMDFDGCLEKCSTGIGAGLIHLRRIDKILIPGLPPAENGTHLTVVTESNANAKKIYHFRVVSGSGKPKYSEIEVIGDSIKTKDSAMQPRAKKAIDDSRFITKGMQIALQNKWIASDGELWQRLNQAVSLRSQGADINVVVKEAGVSIELVEKLISLGKNNR